MQIDWNTEHWNFGYVEENSILEFSFVYYEGKIVNVDSGCSCTTTKASENSIKAKLKVGSVAPDRKLKIKNSTLTVTTDNGKVHKLLLTAKVKK